MTDSPLLAAAQEISNPDAGEQTEIPGTERRERAKPGPKPGSRRNKGPGAGPGASRARIENATAAVAPPTDPKDLEPILRGILITAAKLTGTRPPDEEEIREGAKAAVPAWDRHVIAGMAKAGPWAPLVMFVTVYTLPRAIEQIEAARAARKAARAIELEVRRGASEPDMPGSEAPAQPFRANPDGSISRAG